MSAEKQLFICRNYNCGGKDSAGGMVFQYETPEKGKPYFCPHCESEYIEKDGIILYKAGQNKKGETIFESSDDYNDFRTQYETNHIYFPKLIIRNIKESDYQGRSISFSKCRIDELIIQDIDIVSSFCPISLSECKIEEIRIINSRITGAKRKNYKSLWSFYGINFFQTEIKKSFIVEGLDTSMMISNSEVPCPINISEKSKIDLGLQHNKRDPEIIADKSSSVDYPFRSSGRNPSALVKKVITSGKTIKGITIEELHIDPKIEEATLLEDCTIRKLVFQDGSNINGKLIFKNCYIRSIQNVPFCFEKDVIFLGCTFEDELVLSNVNCRQSLILEACHFLKDAILNNLKVERDLHLSYSRFDLELIISANHSAGYIKSHFVVVQDNITFDDNVIAREVNFSNIHCGKDLKISNNEIKGYLFLRQIRTGGKLEISWLNVAELDIDDITINKGLDISEVFLHKTLRIKKMEVMEKASFSFVRLSGEIFIDRSVFDDEFSIIACEAKGNIHFFSNTIIRKSCLFGFNTFSNSCTFQKNLLQDQLVWQKMKLDDISFNNNRIEEGLNIESMEANDLSIKNNYVYKDLDINFTEIDDLSFSNNRTQKFKIFKGSYAEIDISACDEIGEVELNNLTANKDIYIKDCDLLRKLTVENCNISNKLEIKGTKAPALIYLKSNHADFLDIDSIITKNINISIGSYRQIDIYNCKMIGTLSSNNTTVGKDIIIKENVFYEDFEILYNKVENDLELKKNVYWKNLFLSNNTVNGSIIQHEDHTKGAYLIGKNIIRGNLELFNTSHEGFLMIMDNTVEQQFNLKDPKEDILYDIEIERNKFNYVNIGSFRCEAIFTFDHNNVQGVIHLGKREGEEGNKLIHFKRAVSFCENRIRSGFFSNAFFYSAVCLFNNFIERDLYFRDTEFDKAIDLGGTFIGGSCIFRKSSNDVSREEGDLILDSCFVDKKVELVNTRPSSFSFNNATLNGFNIPNDWKISFWTGRFFSKISGNYIFREKMLQKADLKKEKLPYSTILSHVGPATWYQLMYETWSYLQWAVFSDEEKSYWVKAGIRRGEDVFALKDEINTCVLKNFYPAYYGFMDENQLNVLQELAKDISEINTNYEDNEVQKVFTYLRNFFSSFGTALEYFRKHTLFSEIVDHSNDPREVKNEINESLREQFKVLRHIFGSDGDLVNEDRAYGKWMHYKNVSDRKNAFLKKKTGTWLKFSLKGLLFEKIFGWGVNLPQILFSTLGMVIIFTFIYYFMFLMNPDLSVHWDGIKVEGVNIGFWDSGVFALQTTFSAALGDWAPIGSGAIKIPMTINAVLGVLMVTFMIGAYGRKMLR